MTILKNIKKLLGIDEEDDSFDTDLTILINSSFFKLSQIGIGPKSPFVITCDSTWDDFMKVPEECIESIKTYIFIQTKIIFDPPANSIVAEAYKSEIKELEFRLQLAVENEELMMIGGDENDDSIQ